MIKLFLVLVTITSLSAFAADEKVQQQQQQQSQCQTGVGNIGNIHEDVHIKFMNNEIEKKFNKDGLTLIDTRLINDDPETLTKYEGVGSKLRYLRDASLVYTLRTLFGLVTRSTSCVWETFERSDYERVNLYEVEFQKQNGESCQQLVTIHSIYGAGETWYGKPVVKYHEKRCD